MAVVVASAALLTGCGVEQAAQLRLVEQAESVHQRALIFGFAHPSASGSGDAEMLGVAIAGSAPTSVVSAAKTEDGVEVISAVGTQVTGGGWGDTPETWGACLLTTVADETVETDAVPCPDGVRPKFDGRPVDSVTTGLNRLSSPVSEGRPRTPCYSGSGDCGGGG